MAKERGYGIPRTDIERAMAHYNITEAEYCANPETYSLPERGTGLTTGAAAGSNPGTALGFGALVVMGLVVWILAGRK